MCPFTFYPYSRKLSLAILYLGTFIIKWDIFAWVLSDLDIGSLHISFLIGKMGIVKIALWRFRNCDDDDEVTTEKCPKQCSV